MVSLGGTEAELEAALDSAVTDVRRSLDQAFACVN